MKTILADELKLIIKEYEDLTGIINSYGIAPITISVPLVADPKKPSPVRHRLKTTRLSRNTSDHVIQTLTNRKKELEQILDRYNIKF